MPQQLLHHLKLSPHTSQQGQVGVPERMPSELLLNSGSLGCRTYVFAQDRLPPVRSPASIALACKNPVLRPDVGTTFSPLRQSVRESRMHWHCTGFCDDSVLHGPTTPYTMERMTLIVPRSKSISPHFRPNISLCRNPVDAARRTIIMCVLEVPGRRLAP